MKRLIRTYGLCDCGRYRTDPEAPACADCGKTYATNPAFAPPEILSTDCSASLFEASRRKHTQEIVEYILRGPGRRIVPKKIYLAAWELQYALKREQNDLFTNSAPPK